MTISFIIAVYNNPKYLLFAVQSITKQIRSTDIEIYIVDDGSTDNTPTIADEIAASDDRVKVIHQENQWIYASFNNGIMAAKGEYIYKLVDGAVQLLLDSIEKYDHPDVIWTKVIWQDVDENQNVLSEYDMNETITCDEYISSSELVHRRWLDVLTSGVAVNQANLYKRELALKHPFRNDYYAGDSFFNIGIADDINSMVFLGSPIYCYLAYRNEQMNASIGKYYGYEHKMFNELTSLELFVYEKWNMRDFFIENVVLRRLKEMTYEMEIMEFNNCDISCSGKVKRIFDTIADSFIRDLSKAVGREREYESRLLTGARRLIRNLDIEVNSIPEFVQILIGYLPEDYLQNVDRSIIDNAKLFSAINDMKNLDGVGRIYYFEDW